MASDFVLQIRHIHSGEYIEFAPGLAVESQILEELCDRVNAKGVGIGRTSEHVINSIRSSFQELFWDLKKQMK